MKTAFDESSDFEQEITARRRDAELMEDVELWTPAPCCSDPANYTRHPNLERDRDTGYFEEDSYVCQCGNVLGAYDYEQLVRWRMNQEAEPDAVPEEINQQTRIRPGRVA